MLRIRPIFSGHTFPGHVALGLALVAGAAAVGLWPGALARSADELGGAGRPVRETKVHLASLAKESGYRLGENENLRRMAPPYPSPRDALADHRPGTLISQFPTAGLVFSWSGETLRMKSRLWSESPGGGAPLSFILERVLDIPRDLVDGDKDLILGTSIAGDWVVREGASREQAVKQLTAILHDQLDLPIRLELRQVERPVYVVRGTYKYTAIGGPDRQANAGSGSDLIEIFGSEMVDSKGGIPGSYEKFLDHLGAWVNCRMVSEVEQPPARGLCWTVHTHPQGPAELSAHDHDPDLVLANVSRQTNLRFDKETRKITILFVAAIPRTSK